MSELEYQEKFADLTIYTYVGRARNIQDEKKADQ